MIRILIVDDELIVRIGIRSMIEWEKNGYEIVGEAADGAEALELIRSLAPDIVLTDIKMPRMDGIGLLQRIQEEALPVRTVVLSCYNEFDYVKKALKLGASDYVLKLSMQPQDLLNVMDAVGAELSKAPTHGRRPAAAPGEDWLQAARRLLLQKEPGGPADPAALPGRFLVLAVKIRRKQLLHAEAGDAPGLQGTAQNFIADILSERMDCGCFSYGSEAVAVVVRPAPQGPPPMDALRALIARFQALIETHLNCVTTVGLAPSAVTADGMRQAFAEALLAASYGFYFEGNRVFTPRQVRYARNSSHLFDFGKIRWYFDQLNLCQTDSVRQDLEAVLDDLAARRDIHPNDVRKACKAVLNVLHMGLLCQIYEESVYKGANLPDVETVDQIGTLAQLREVLLQGLDTFSDIQNSRPGTYHGRLQELRDYLTQHISEKITLEDAAAFVNLSKNYFCSVFKLEFGTTFNDYLTDLRVSAAKKLLKTTSLSIYEVAERSGYDNPNYFFTIFRKTTGMSPNQYRNT